MVLMSSFLAMSPSILLPQSEDSMKTYVKTGFSWNLLDTVVMGGLFSSTVLTLFLLPVLYEWVCANRRLQWNSSKMRCPQHHKVYGPGVHGDRPCVKSDKEFGES